MSLRSHRTCALSQTSEYGHSVLQNICLLPFPAFFSTIWGLVNLSARLVFVWLFSSAILGCCFPSTTTSSFPMEKAQKSPQEPLLHSVPVTPQAGLLAWQPCQRVLIVHNPALLLSGFPLVCFLFQHQHQNCHPEMPFCG